LSVADPATVRKALGFYDQAVALDPTFVQAWAEASIANSLLYANGVPTPELSERARLAAAAAAAKSWEPASKGPTRVTLTQSMPRHDALGGVVRRSSLNP